MSGTARQPIAIDIPQSPISFDVSIGGQPLPAMSCDGDAHNLYAVARDTDVWHSFAYWGWNINGDLVGPEFGERLIPGTYDLLYRKGQSSSDLGYAFRTDSNDVRYVGVCIQVP